MASEVKTAEEIFLMMTPIVKALVDLPAELSVEFTPDRRFVIHVTPDPSDTGKIIGKQGRTARAIRTILAAYAQKEKIVLSLDINESGKAVTA